MKLEAQRYFVFHYDTHVGSISGHTFIDILKIDTEGGDAEFEALTSSSTRFKLPVTAPLVNFNSRFTPVATVDSSSTLSNCFKWWGSLEASGLRPFSFEPKLNLTTHQGATRAK